MSGDLESVAVVSYGYPCTADRIFLIPLQGNMRQFLKALAHGVARVLVLPFLLPYGAVCLLKGKDMALQDTTEFLALLPGILGRYLRRAFLAWTIEECHASADIGFGTTFSKSGARIGSKVYVGAYCSIGLATIEPDVTIASGVYITSGARQHGSDDLTKPIREQPGVNQRVRIGAGSWIGSHAVVMADIGNGTIVAAGAVVNQSVGEFLVVGGVPARVLKSRRDNDIGPAQRAEVRSRLVDE
jgi:virginiamycin A acetyltransferase